MTSHRLIRCDWAQALSAAAGFGRWVHLDQHREGSRARLHWQSGVGARRLTWTLEMEQGANGVLAHLSADPVCGPLRRLTPVLRRIALQPMSEHELTRLAASATLRQPKPGS